MLKVLATAAAIFGGLALLICGYEVFGITEPGNAIHAVSVIEQKSGNGSFLVVEGRLVSSAEAITRISQAREGDTVRVVVKSALVSSWNDEGRFTINVPEATRVNKIVVGPDGNDVEILRR